MNNLSSILEKPTINTAFFMQYISVMIILLCMIIGLFSQIPHITPAIKLKRRAYSEPPSIGEIWFSNLFESNSSKLIDSNCWAITEVLKSHDIDSTIDIYGGGNIELALARTISLYSYFESVGVPTGAVRIFALSGGESGDAKISFDLEVGR